MFKPKETIIEIKDERQLKSICGVTESQLKIIAQEFELVETEDKQAQYEQMVLMSKWSFHILGIDHPVVDIKGF